MTEILQGRTVMLIFLCIGIFSFTSNGQNILDKKITVSFEGSNLQEALDIIKSSTEVPFVYAESIFENEKKHISYNANNETLQRVLTKIFNNTKIDFKATEGRVVLFSNPNKSIKSNPTNKKRHTISGYISDATTGERLIGANIYRPNRQSGTTTNVHGFFSLTLPSTEYQLAVSYIGYETEIFQIDLRSNQSVNLELNPSNQLLEVEIIADEELYKPSNHAQMSISKLNIKQAKTLPAIGGEVDLMKIIQLQPGVSSGVEGTSGLYVRGGSNDQNLILLDGVPVYNPSHLFGFVSVINEEAINSMEIIKGGFPARYSGRLSSIVDIRMKEGNSKHFEFGGTLSPISSKLYIQGPIIKEKMSFLVTARRSFVDLFMRPQVEKNRSNNGDGGTSGYYFYDVNAKLNYKFSNKDQVYLSYFRANDKFDDSFIATNSFGSTESERIDLSEIAWSNELAAFRWNHKFGNKIFGNLIFNTTAYNYGLLSREDYKVSEGGNIETTFSDFNFKSDIRDYSLRYNFDIVPTRNHYIRIGAYGTRHEYKPGVTAFEADFGAMSVDTIYNNQIVDTEEAGVYIEDEFKLGKRIFFNLGVAANQYKVEGEYFSSIEPRLSSSLKFFKNTALKFSYSQMNQYLHLLASSGVGLPSDLWIPVTKNIKPQYAEQFAVGLAHDANRKYSVIVEGYYKNLENLIEYKEGTSFLNTSDRIDERITSGTGIAYGVELEVRKNIGKMTGWFSYTWSKSERTFADLNGGKTFPFVYDRRHDASIVLSQKLGNRWTIAGNWVFNSGRGITIPVQYYDGNSSALGISGITEFVMPNNIQYGDKNSYRLKPYHRLDLSISYRKDTRWGENTFTLSAYNAYNQANTFYVKSELKDLNIQFSEVSYFSFLPGISYSFKFNKAGKKNK